MRCLITFALEKSIPALVKAGYENDAHLHLYHTGQQKCLPVNSISFEHGHKILWNKHASSGNE